MLVVDLFPTEVRKSVPPLNSQEGISDPVVYCKFFTSDSDWRWYVREGSPEEDDFLFFGFVMGLENEWGQFSLSELRDVRGPFQAAVERDLHFQPAPLSEVLKRERR